MSRIVSHEDNWRNGDTFRLYGIGDIHLGSPTVDEDALRELVDEIADDPLARWVGMGDYGDLIGYRDRRFEPGVLSRRYLDAIQAEGGIPSETVAHAVEILEPIRGKCLALIEGNHETAVRKYTDRSIGNELARELNLSHRFLGYSGFVRWVFRRESSNSRASTRVMIHLHHGWQAGRRPGAVANQAQVEKSYYPDADIIMRGHNHKHGGVVFDALKAHAKHVRRASWVFVNTGTFKTGTEHPGEGQPSFASYEERRGFEPKGAVVGPPCIEVTPRAVGTDPTKYDFDFRVVLG